MNRARKPVINTDAVHWQGAFSSGSLWMPLLLRAGRLRASARCCGANHRVSKRLSMGMVFGKVSEETPAFEMLKDTESFQVRQYAPSVSAETTYISAGGLDENTSDAFRRLAQYIGVFSTPQNKNAAGLAEPVSMTAPVLLAPPGAQAITGSPSAAPTTALDESVTAGLTQGARSGPRTMAFLLPAKSVSIDSPS
mgnify:CR=1 FL=1